MMNKNPFMTQPSIHSSGGLSRENITVLSIVSAVIISNFTIFGAIYHDSFLFLLVSFMMIIMLVPFFRGYLTRTKVDVGAPIVFILIQYFLYFGYRAIYLTIRPGDAFIASWGTPPPYSSSEAQKALIYVLLGLIAMVIAYYLNLGKKIAEELPQIKATLKPIKTKVPAYLVIIVGIICQLLLLATGHGTANNGNVDVPVYLNLLQMLSKFLPLGLALALCIHFSEKGRRDLFLIVMFFMIYFILGLYVGWRSLFLHSMWLVVLPYNYLRKKINIGKIMIISSILIFITFAFIYPLLSYYRLILPDEGYAPKQALSRAVSETEFKGIEGRIESFSNRFLGLDSFMLVQRSNQRMLGKTFLFSFSSFVPRVIWKSKPNMDVGRLFAIQFWKQPTKVQNSISVMNISDLMWNFEIVGIIFGMALLGLIYRVIYEYSLKDVTPGSVFLYTSLFTVFQGIEAGVGALIVQLIINLVLAILIIEFSGLFGNLFTKDTALSY